MKKLFIIKTGSAFTKTAEKYGDFEEMICHGLGLKRKNISIVDAPRGEELPAADLCHGAVITGAHCMVTDNLSWSLAIEAWIPSLVQAEVPLLGICYGHQLLGRAMGGQVDFHPQGKEVGTVAIRRLPASDNDLLFDQMPRQFQVHATHAQSVIELPSEAVLLAENDFEGHHAFRIGRCAWGVQFHPEYTSNVMRDYLLAQADSLALAGRDVQALLQDLRETTEANSLLKTFAKLAVEEDS